MLDIVHRVTLGRLKKAKNIPEFSAGDTVSVYVKVKEGEKERVQVYTGVVLKIQGNGMSRSFTVRKVSSGVGVERTFPFLSPAIEKVETVTQGRVRKSRLYYLRDLKGRAARLKSQLVHAEGEAVGAADDIPSPVEKAAAAPVEATTVSPKESAPKKA